MWNSCCFNKKAVFRVVNSLYQMVKIISRLSRYSGEGFRLYFL